MEGKEITLNIMQDLGISAPIPGYHHPYLQEGNVPYFIFRS
jgi:hypothetical protein